jgi:chromosome partitioning protein
METLLIHSQKGGSGKSTIAVHLAVCAVNRGKKTAVLDIDPQGNVMDWNTSRPEDKQLDMAQVQAAQLDGILRGIEQSGTELVIIDTSPRADSEAAIAARHVDFVVVPCQTSRFDMKAIMPTVQMLRMSNTPFVVVLSMVGKGRLINDTRSYFAERGIPVMDTVLHRLVAYNYALFDGSSVHEYEPGGKAATEIDRFYEELQQFIKTVETPREVVNG